MDKQIDNDLDALSDDQLEAVACGITAKQIETVEKAIKNSKMLHMSLERTVEALSIRLKPDFPLARWSQEMMHYLIAHWDEVG